MRKRIRKPSTKGISAIAVVALDTRIETVMKIWTLAHKYQSWDIASFMENPPSRTNIWKTQRIVEELS